MSHFSTTRLNRQRRESTEAVAQALRIVDHVFEKWGISGTFGEFGAAGAKKRT